MEHTLAIIKPDAVSKGYLGKIAARIEADAKAMVDNLGGPDGGFIAGYYGGNEALGLDPKWQDIACKAFTRYGEYDLPKEAKI